jgi:hypothetical protein
MNEKQIAVTFHEKTAIKTILFMQKTKLTVACKTYSALIF